MATDAATGTELWRNDDHLVYDDVWAVGDGAVYMNHQTGSESTVVAYELTTGDIGGNARLARSRTRGGSTASGSSRRGRTSSALRTDDGSVLLTSDYPQTETGFPAPRAVVTNDTSVFVSFASGFGSGD